MKRFARSIFLLAVPALLFGFAGAARAQDGAQPKTPQTPTQAILENWNDLGNHLAGTKVGEAQNDPPVSQYKTKAETVAYLKKSVADGATLLQKQGDAEAVKHLSGWIGYTEHMGEHYGLLVAYYRATGGVPPESRPKK